MNNLTRLREIAEAATAGPWYAHDFGRGHGGWQIHFYTDPERKIGRILARALNFPQTGADTTQAAANAAFIAAANPQAVLELLDRVEGLERALEPFARFLDALEQLGGNSPKTGTWYSVETSGAGLREISVEDFIAARQALTPQRETER